MGYSRGSPVTQLMGHRVLVQPDPDCPVLLQSSKLAALDVTSPPLLLSVHPFRTCVLVGRGLCSWLSQGLRIGAPGQAGELRPPGSL